MKNDGHLKSDSCKHVARQAIQLCRVQQMAHYGQVWPQRIPSYEAMLNILNRHTIVILYHFVDGSSSYTCFMKTEWFSIFLSQKQSFCKTRLNQI